LLCLAPQHVICVIRPPGTLVPGGVRSGRPYVLLQMFLFFRRATSELPRPIAVKLCHVIAIWVRLIMQVQKFRGPFPKEIGGQKHAKFGAISDNFKLRSRISPEQVKYPKSERNLFTADSSRVPQKCPMNFGPQITENCM